MRVKKLIFLISLLLLDFSIFAEMSFLLEPYSTVTLGSMSKYLYSSEKERILSKLEWETKPLISAGLKTQFEYNSFGFSVCGDFAIPMISGKMYDSDYYYNSEFPNGNKCNYSIHDNKALLNANTDISIFYTTKINLNPVINVQYTYDSFIAQNGYGWYGRYVYSTTGEDESWDSPYAIKVKVLGVEYYRHTFYTWIGFYFKVPQISFPKDRALIFSASFFVSPFTYTSAMDYHLSKKGNDYHQMEIQYSYFTRLKWDVGAQFQISRRISIGTTAQWIYGFLQKGPMYTDKNNSKGLLEESTQKCGSDIFNCRITLSCDIKLF